MKTLNKIFATTLASIVMFTSTSALANGNKPDSTSTDITFEEEIISDAELDMIIMDLENDDELWLESTVTYEIYDNNDNLVISLDVKRSEPLNNQKLSKLVAKSDFLMSYNNTNYYRLRN